MRLILEVLRYIHCSTYSVVPLWHSQFPPKFLQYTPHSLPVRMRHGVFCGFKLNHILLQSLLCCIKYYVILDCIMTAFDCISCEFLYCFRMIQISLRRCMKLISRASISTLVWVIGHDPTMDRCNASSHWMLLRVMWSATANQMWCWMV